MKLPELNIQPTPEWQKQRLTRWLADWKTSAILESSDPDRDRDRHYTAHDPTSDPDRDRHYTAHDPTSDPDRDRHYTAPASDIATELVAPLSNEPSPEPGQIRLLSPSIHGADTRPVHVAILQEEDPETFTISPFSRFSEPATEKELLTGRDTPFLRVLCLWNAQHIPLHILQKSWLVDEMSHDELNDAITILGYRSTDCLLSPSLAQRIGPEIVHPLDPRHDYLQQESELMQQIISPNKTSFPYHIDKGTDLPMAAEDHEDYGKE
jgi:hypothetical protein